MVTSNKNSDKKVVTMTEQNSVGLLPTRTLLGEVNDHLTCVLCRGYYIDATTIVECLHSFCRSCIIKHLKENKTYCPVCGVMINTTKPDIKPDKALQDIVYKLVPGLFQREMERRRQFYSLRPGQAASATPEQRGEDTERIIFSPEDVISFSLEYVDTTDSESISSRSSDSSGETPSNHTLRRYIQCPAVVNIRQLKKFLANKFDIDYSQFSIEILYKRVPLPDYYTLMDIAYIYNWKRNEPMKFFYQITDRLAIRNRYELFDRKDSNFKDSKPSPTRIDDTSSPAPTLNDQSSEASSGTNSPMPDDSSSCRSSNNNKKFDKNHESKLARKDDEKKDEPNDEPEDVEKSQFLNSFELTAKNSVSNKSSPTKMESDTIELKEKTLNANNIEKLNDTLSKRKSEDKSTPHVPDTKKIKIEKETKSVSKSPIKSTPATYSRQSSGHHKPQIKQEETQKIKMSISQGQVKTTIETKDSKITSITKPLITKPIPEMQSLKRPLSTHTSTPQPKKKHEDSSSAQQKTTLKTLSKTDEKPKSDSPKVPVKTLPDLKINMSNATPLLPSKPTIVKGIRTDLLANNSDPTNDRSKLLAHANPNNPNMTGDSWKSLFNSCKINIPSSLSITLTDQKSDPRAVNENSIENRNSTEPKKTYMNKTPLSGVGPSNPMKTPSPPVHNYIEILKIPDADPKKSARTENQTKAPPTKSETSSAKGPVPNLKPISDTKIGKGNFSKPTTYQQTFIQSLAQNDKQKLTGKAKTPVPKLVPAIPKPMATNDGKDSQSKPAVPAIENKPKGDNVLDLSQQTSKALETMQSIANLAKKHINMPPKLTSIGTPPSSFSNIPSNKTFSGISSPLRVPVPNLNKQPKAPISNPIASQTNVRPEGFHQVYKPSPNRPPSSSPLSNAKVAANQTGLNTSVNSRASPISQTRSPSTSPKLVIAEDKQTSPSTSESNVNQSNLVSSSQISSTNVPNSDSSSSSLSPGLVKPAKITKAPIAPKLNNMRLPSASVSKPSTSNPQPSPDFIPTLPQHLLASQAAFLRQMEMQSHLGHLFQTSDQWLKMKEAFIKNMTSQNQNDFQKK